MSSTSLTNYHWQTMGRAHAAGREAVLLAAIAGLGYPRRIAMLVGACRTKQLETSGLQRKSVLGAALALTGLLACAPGPSDGATDSTPGAGGLPVGASGGSPGTGGAPSQDGVLLARTWRLSHEQYRQSVLDLVGVEPDLDNFTPESGNGKFSNFASTALVQVDLAANYHDVATSLAESLTPLELAALTSCDLQAACQATFITELGERAFRAPVPAEVGARLAALFDLAAAEADTEAGYRAVLTAILNSPLFLYRKEIGPAEDTQSPEFSLTPAQIAEFLSYSLLDSPPPAWLRDQAESGALTQSTLPVAIAQLLADPAFELQLTSFLTEWLEVAHFDTVEKSDVFPGFDQAKALMAQELQVFFEQSGRREHGLRRLLLDPVPSVALELDSFYYSDPSAPSVGARMGVIGLGAVMASHAKSYLTSPTLRGLFIRARLFCQEVSLPPGFTPPPLSETEVLGIAQTTRQLYERHLSDASCSNCHSLLDNIGFSLEAFDGAGRFRTLDTTQGASVVLDTVSTLTGSDVDRPLTGAADLSQALSESAQVRQCLARQAFRFYFGQVEGIEDLPAIQAGTERLTAVDTLGDLTEGLLSTDNTFMRKREAGN